MTSTKEQLTLSLPCRESLGGEDFLIAASNQDAVAWIDRWPAWPNNVLLLHGPAGSGKSHLAAVWQAASGAASLPASALDDAAVARAREHPRLVLEDADRQRTREFETALFHLINSIRETGGSLLITSRKPAGRWRAKLPDLASRLRALPQTGLKEPDEALMAAVLIKQFSDRQLRIGVDLADYLVARLDRSFDRLRDAVDSLDRAALAERRPLTIPFARKILNL
ncbi:HdaA/DnaA family protein [Govanella unica]|uniref:DnaA/Hda family protein n=1 Tax=Govanella unica TaxID=2975056 RepID=A0A9X3Z7T3_9PROT|nr:DnaA/Hda family protein [Govania unica]MDA5194373.1 DnaA/Hda family protein [Govania unica]